ncbi:hypothetical protein STCU_00679 [Strigomonas culicis]|uniref:CRAL-TRIO domain-containing protein n=1 Tax=Strigomonas culicis TaxID=28005 RepID=S9WAW1_9TRYP|nr:hypothetical protein STCU_00679 [Strigomonas culicis]|eukprot:EPY36251.1 hypothetical protein STCU_00679 [Strigomonas culicis]
MFGGDAEAKDGTADAEARPAASAVALKGAEHLPAVYLRFARARGNNYKKAAEQLESALKWRAEKKPYAIQPSQVQRMMEHHTTAIGGFCNEGRPVVIVRLGAKSPCTTEERVDHLIFLMEEMHRRGYETITWVVDFTLFGGRNKTEKMKTEADDGDERPKETRKQTSHITQTYYPERLGKLLMYNYPWYIGILMTIAHAFIDAGTRKKMFLVGHDLKAMDAHVKKSQLPQCMGGDLPDNGYENFEALGNYDEKRIATLLEKVKQEPCP